MGYSINKMIAEIKKRGNIMAGLAKEFEQLGCWESATEEENIVILEWISKTKKFLLSLRMIWEKPLSMQKLLLLPPAIAKMIVFTGAKNWKLRCLATYVQRIQTRLVCIAACFGSL